MPTRRSRSKRMCYKTMPIIVPSKGCPTSKDQCPVPDIDFELWMHPSSKIITMVTFIRRG